MDSLPTLPRRRLLGLLAAPAVLVARPGRIAAGGDDENQSAAAAPDAALDPQIRRLRAIEIEEHVEPALVFEPRRN
jgi:hypothetical protein